MTSSNRTREAALLFGVVLLATGLAAVGLSRESYWLDEAYSVVIAGLPVPALIAETAKDVHPPAYYLLLHYWMLAVGTSEAATRALSLVVSGVTIVLAWQFTRRAFDARTAIAAATVLAVSPLRIEFAQETRMYALLACLGTASMGSFWHFARAPTLAGLLIYAVTTALALYTHVHALFLVATQWVVWAFAHRNGHAPGLAWWLTAQGMLLALFAPWIPTLVAQVSRVQQGFWIPPLPWSAPALPYMAFAGSHRLALVLAGLACVGLLALWRARTRPIESMTCWWLTGWAIVPVLLPLLISLVSSPIFLPKYTVSASIPFAMLAALGLVQIRHVAGRVAILAVIVGLSGATILQNGKSLRKDGWRQAVSRLETYALPGDVVIAHPSFNRIPVKLYLRRSDLAVDGLSAASSDIEAVCQELSKHLHRARRVWIVGLKSSREFEALEEVMAAIGTRVAIDEVQHVRLAAFSPRTVQGKPDQGCPAASTPMPNSARTSSMRKPYLRASGTNGI